MNKERKMGERKIAVTATLRYAPSRHAEFLASDFYSHTIGELFLHLD